MWKYYSGIVREIPKGFREMMESFQFWALLALTVASWAWPHIDALRNAYAVPSWVSPTAFALLIVWNLLRINYQRVQGAEEKTREVQKALAKMEDKTPEIQDVMLFQHRSRQNMFDLRVDMLVRDQTAFRNKWVLDLTLVSGEKIEGIQGQIASHAFNESVGTYPLTVSFPFGARIPDLAALAGATIDRLSGVDAVPRPFAFVPPPGTPLLPWQEASVF